MDACVRVPGEHPRAGACGCGRARARCRCPPRPSLLNAAGAEALARGDLSTAEARLSVALEYSPRFVEAWVNLGYVELRRGNFEQARRDFLKARALNQDIPAPHHALGVLADAAGRRALTPRSCYRAALAVDPGSRRRGRTSRGGSSRAGSTRTRASSSSGCARWRRTPSRAGRARPSRCCSSTGRRRRRPSWSTRAPAAGRRAGADARAARALRLAARRLGRGRGGASRRWSGAATGRARAAAWAWIAVARAGRGDLAGAARGGAVRRSPSTATTPWPLRAAPREPRAMTPGAALSAGRGTPSLRARG